MAQIRQKFIQNNAVNADKLADNSVDSAALQNGSVIEDKIGAAAVVESKISNSAVTEVKIANNAVSSAKIAADAVTSSKIENEAVIETKIATGAVTDNKIATGISATKLADGSVTDTEFQYLDGVTGPIQTQLNAKIESSEKGAANGVATLDAGGKIPAAQLPNSVMDYQGSWNASTNSPTLANGTGNAGDVYRVSVAGTQNLGAGNISFEIGDLVIYNGSIWERSPLGVVMSVDEKQTFVLGAGDITNGYIDLANIADTDSISFMVRGAPVLLEGASYDYTVNYTGGAGGNTRITWLNDLATGGGAELIAGDVVQVKYRY